MHSLGGSGDAEGKAGGGTAKAPVKECEQGRKWVIENFVGDTNVVVSDTNPKQAVYISNCKNSVIKAILPPSTLSMQTVYVSRSS